MGRFKAGTIKVRQVDGLTIVFKDSRTIYLGYDDIWVVFNIPFVSSRRAPRLRIKEVEYV